MPRLDYVVLVYWQKVFLVVYGYQQKSLTAAPGILLGENRILTISCWNEHSVLKPYEKQYYS